MENKLKQMTDEELNGFVRQRLLFESDVLHSMRQFDIHDHYRFDMSGGVDEDLGECNVYNNRLLMKFVDCGIYDYVNYLYVYSYKGQIDIHYGDWADEEIIGKDDDYWCKRKGYVKNYGGYGTTEIIVDILKRLVIDKK